MRLTVDRIVENIAVCMDENEIITEIELSMLPADVKEGSILNSYEDGSFELDLQAEEERRKMLFEMQNALFDE